MAILAGSDPEEMRLAAMSPTSTIVVLVTIGQVIELPLLEEHKTVLVEFAFVAVASPQADEGQHGSAPDLEYPAVS